MVSSRRARLVWLAKLNTFFKRWKLPTRCHSITWVELCLRQTLPMTLLVLVNAFGLNGKGEKAVELYQGLSPAMRNDITHICVLNACSHSGLVDDARSIFNGISSKTIKMITAMVCQSGFVSHLNLNDSIHSFFLVFFQPRSIVWVGCVCSMKLKIWSPTSRRTTHRILRCIVCWFMVENRQFC